MKCLIIDDDEASRAVLSQLVKQVGFLQLAAICKSSAEAINLLQKESFDLVFLDIEMPEMSGIDMLKSMAMPPTILTTSHKEYALDAFEYNIIDYLVKPVSLPRFIKAVEKARSHKSAVASVAETNDKEYFFIRKDSVLTKVPIKEILWIEALGDYLTVHTINNKYILHSTLKAIEGKIPAEKFIRVHRSFIINIDNVSSVEDTTIYINNTAIPVGAIYKENFIRVLNLL